MALCTNGLLACPRALLGVPRADHRPPIPPRLCVRAQCPCWPSDEGTRSLRAKGCPWGCSGCFPLSLGLTPVSQCEPAVSRNYGRCVQTALYLAPPTHGAPVATELPLPTRHVASISFPSSVDLPGRSLWGRFGLIPVFLVINSTSVHVFITNPSFL